MSEAPRCYGLLAEFSSPERLLAAVRAAREAGYAKLEAFSPFPLQELDAALGLHDRRATWCGIAGGLFGGLLGFGLQVYVNLDYPLSIGNRPLIALPAFVLVTFLLGVLGAALGAVFGLFWLCRLPLLHHPLFAASAFARASDDRFLLCIRGDDPCFHREDTALWLAARAITVTEVLA